MYFVAFAESPNFRFVKRFNYFNYISLLLFLLFVWSGIDQWAARFQWTFLILFFISLFLFPFLKGYYEPPSKSPEPGQKEEERTWWKDFGGVVYHIIVAIGIGAGAKMHENDFGGLRFLWVSLFAGAVIGFLIYRALLLFYAHWPLFNQHKEKFCIEIIFACIFLAACLGPFINQYKNNKPASCSTFIIDPRDRQKQSHGKYITLLTERGKERFEPPPRLLNRMQAGDSVLEVCIKKGRLGFDYVDEFRLPEKKTPDAINQ